MILNIIQASISLRTQDSYINPSKPYIPMYTWVVVKIMAPFLGTLNIRCRILIRTEKGTIILTTTHVYDALLASARPRQPGVVAECLEHTRSKAWRLTMLTW